MGIQGLLPYLEPATRPCHVSEFRGGAAAVDAYCFLHKGANAAAEQLVRGEDNQIYVKYCLKYVKMLLNHDIHPIMVFDGRNLPAKADTEAKRRENRKRAKEKGAQLLQLGKIEEARNYLRQCIDITPKMAHNLIKACRDLNVDCIVAPYESDAQLSFFDQKNAINVVITEDSDLVLFGCKKVLYKLDLSGAGRLVESDKIHLAMKMRPDQYTFDKFRLMCILSGCDYIESLYGIGLKKAEKFLKLTAETNPEIFLNKLPSYLKMKQLVITDEYKQKFMIAIATFLHQVVFDPFKKCLVNLNHPQKTGTKPDYLVNCGEKFNNEQAFQIAIGNMDPYTETRYSDWMPEEVPQHSIWAKAFKKRISREELKETKKNQFKEFFTKTEKTISEAEDAMEEQRNMEDLRIEQELLFYVTNKTDVKENIKEEPPQEVSQKGPSLSPIISKNPFLKKKLSKFPRTQSDSTLIVKSRFFHKETADIGEAKAEINTQTTAHETYKNEQCVIILDDETEQVNIKSEQSKPSIELDDEPKKRSFKVMKDDETEAALLTVEDELNSKLKVSEPQQDKKRKLIGPCKQVGLSKSKKSGPSNQTTLHNFFNKVSKKN